MTGEVLSFMRENYPEQLLTFIEYNISTYTEEVVNEENYILDEMLSVLEMDVDEKYKINLLKITGDALSVKEKGYSDVVKIHILNNNLDMNDIPFLLNNYQNENNSVKETIEDIAIKHISTIIEEQYSMPIELFALILPNMNESQCKTYLSILQMPDYVMLFEGKRPKFEVNNINRVLLTIFENKEWITSFDIDKDDENYYRAYGRKARKKLVREVS